MWLLLKTTGMKSDKAFAVFKKASRFLLGENASCHLVSLTALQSAHRWTVEKKKYRK